MFVEVQSQFLCIFKMIPQFQFLLLDSFQFLLHHLRIFAQFLFLVLQCGLFALQIRFLLFQYAQLLQVEFDRLPLFVHFIVLVGDLFVEDGVVLSKAAYLCLRVGSDFVGSLQGVVQSFVDFLRGRGVTSPRVRVQFSMSSCTFCYFSYNSAVSSFRFSRSSSRVLCMALMSSCVGGWNYFDLFELALEEVDKFLLGLGDGAFCRHIIKLKLQKLNGLYNYSIIASTMEIEPKREVSILCPMCGMQFIPSIGNICEACAIARSDITLGITKEAMVNYCRFCHRYQRPPWVFCDRDSKDLLSLLLKKIKGLNRAKILKAGFVWTEPHSKRIKVKLTVEKEVNNKIKMEQTFITEFIEVYMQCDDCKKEFTPHTWGAVVQVRQHVDHKKTFFLVEQLILKHGVYDKVLKVAVEDDGINFYYKNTTHAQRMIDFLGSLLPITVKNSKQLISHDMNSNTFVYKYAFAVTLPKICKNDLVIIPKKLAKELGGCSQLLLCDKVAESMGFIDLMNFNYVLMSSVQYYHFEKDMHMLSLSKYKREFEILDCNAADRKNHHKIKSTLNKYASRIFFYNVTKAGEWVNIEIRGNMGELPPGTVVEGFDLSHLNYTEEVENINGFQEIVLVRLARTKKSGRVFKLKKLEDEGVMIEEGQTVTKRKKKMEEKENKDYEDFLDDIEADKDLQKGIKLYKNEDRLKQMTKEQLDKEIEDMELVDLMEDMNIEGEAAQELPVGEQAQGIDDLISRMDKVTIDKE